MIFSIEGHETSITQWGLETLSGATQLVADASMVCETIHVKETYPADGIVEAAEQQQCDLIVVGSHGRPGSTRLLLGSQVNHVVRHSTQPVLICR